MKKKRWLAVVALAACALMGFAACKPDEEPGGPGGFVGSKDDEYVDYDPTKQPGGDQFDHDGNYLPPELVIDGKDDDEQWQNAPELLTYGGADGAAVSVKAWRGERAMFFYFDVKDSILLTQGLTNGDEVCRGDSVEIYIDTKADGGRYPQSDDFQFNFGIHGKARIMQGAGSQWGLWNGLIDYEVSINEGSTLNNGAAANDTGYSMEVMVQYKEIMIEKDDTVGIAFGHVDKVQVEDGRDGQYFWYGWNYKGAEVNVQRPETYIFFDKDGNLMSRDELPMPAVDVAGNVKDQDGNAVAGATVTMTADGEEDEPQTTTTDADGYFVFAGTDPEKSYGVTVTKDNYIAATGSYTRAELRAANGEPVVKNFTLTSTASLTYTTLTGTVKNIAYGTVEGATVTVKNTTIEATTGAGGTFSLASVPANNGDVTIVISKAGYDDTELTLAENTMTADSTTALGDLNLNLAVTRGLVVAAATDKGTNKGHFVNAEVTVARTLNGIEFTFDGERKLHAEGQIEVYINKGKTSTKDKENLPDGPLWQFNLYADGRITASRASTSTAGLVYTVHSNTESYQATLLVPYSYLGMQSDPLERFGFAIGEWIETIKAWDPMTLNGGAAIQPNHTTDYLRVDKYNKIYSADHNKKPTTFSGDVGIEGVTVTANGKSTLSGADGAWSMNVPVTSEAITVTYEKAGYVTQTATIAEGYFNADNVTTWTGETISLEEHLVSISGTVTDKKTGTGIEGVTVTIEGTQWTATTDANGAYTIENVTTFEEITVIFSKGEDYLEVKQTYTVEELAEVDSLTLDKELIALNGAQQITISGSVKSLNGALEGATVTVEGMGFTTQTDASGNWSIANVYGIDTNIIISKDGYVSETLELKADEIADGAIAFGSTFLMKEYGTFARSQKSVNPGEANAGIMAGFVYTITRNETELVFRFVGDKPFHTSATEQRVEFNIAPANGTGWVMQLKILPNGTVNGTGSDKVKGLRVLNPDSNQPIIEFRLLYTDVGIAKNDAIRVGGGQWCKKDGAADWNGMNLNGFADAAWGAPRKIFVNADNVAANTLEELSASAASLASELYVEDKKTVGAKG